LQFIFKGDAMRKRVWYIVWIM